MKKIALVLVLSFFQYSYAESCTDNIQSNIYSAVNDRNALYLVADNNKNKRALPAVIPAIVPALPAIGEAIGVIVESIGLGSLLSGDTKKCQPNCDADGLPLVVGLILGKTLQDLMLTILVQ